MQKESQTMATITFQNYFRLYGKLSGMTGTALTEETEFREIYKMDVIVIPTIIVKQVFQLIVKIILIVKVIPRAMYIISDIHTGLLQITDQLIHGQFCQFRVIQIWIFLNQPLQQ